ncbi:10866_t:CDS:2 [Ambispora gerdemannii]|uniref:10866_t:CDS:1 n=1 Tax=Ambispora gerdemannii TaxID=144530 RepID=A0A9N9E094_9GLOM|nr:10866_t:CDS:2 [Ambispora gerdemannii]
MSSYIVAVVTGANKGIGKAIVRNLVFYHANNIPSLKTSTLIVYLTARNNLRGLSATNEINQELDSKKLLVENGGVARVLFHQLDITDDESVQKMRDDVQKAFGGFDILINNAAIGPEFLGESFSPTVAKKTLDTNYWGLIKTTEILLPVIKYPGGKIINIASRFSQIKQIPSKKLQTEFSREDLSLEELNELMRKFEKHTNSGVTVQEGWPTSGTVSYNVSKVGMLAYTKILARRLANEKKQICIQAVNPGWVRTDMGSEKAPLSADQGAETPVYLALSNDPRLEKNGQFWTRKQPEEW